MPKTLLTAMGLLLLPVVVFWAGAWIMLTVSGRTIPAGQTPLNQRCKGYDIGDVHQYWCVLDPSALRAEQRFLEFDLLFPVFYGASLAVSLLAASAMLGRPVHAALLIAPVVVTVAADWIENLVQLEQLRKFIDAGRNGLASGSVHVASTATIVKLTFFCLSSLALIGLLVALVVRSRGAR